MWKYAVQQRITQAFRCVGTFTTMWKYAVQQHFATCIQGAVAFTTMWKYAVQQPQMALQITIEC